MARTKASVANREEEKKKKEKRTEKHSPKTNNRKDSEASSDSDDEMFSKTEKEESGIPKFIKGTTWPVDTSVEVVVNYDAAKEMRSVRKEFYPLLFHMTRSDPRQMSNCISKSKVLLSFIKARIEQQSKDKGRLGLMKELRNLNASPVNCKVSPLKTRRKMSTDSSTAITDLTDAKTEVLKLFARVSLRRQQFAQLLVWIRKLKLCSIQGAGRWGEVYVKDEHGSSTDSIDSSDSDEERKKVTKTRTSRRGRGRGRGRGGLSRNKDWRVALRPSPRKTEKALSPEPTDQKMEARSGRSSSPEIKKTVFDKRIKVPWTVKEKRDISIEDKAKIDRKSSGDMNTSINYDEKSTEKCFVPLVDVVSVLDKRVMDRNKHSAKSNRGRRKMSSVGMDRGDEDFVPNKTYRLSSQTSPDCSSSTDSYPAVPVCLYRADENENMSKPFVEIDNVENGMCVPYEDRFVRKEEEVEKKIIMDSVNTHMLGDSSSKNHGSVSQANSKDTDISRPSIGTKHLNQNVSTSILSNEPRSLLYKDLAMPFPGHQVRSIMENPIGPFTQGLNRMRSELGNTIPTNVHSFVQPVPGVVNSTIPDTISNSNTPQVPCSTPPFASTSQLLSSFDRTGKSLLVNFGNSQYSNNPQHKKDSQTMEVSRVTTISGTALTKSLSNTSQVQSVPKATDIKAEINAGNIIKKNQTIKTGIVTDGATMNFSQHGLKITRQNEPSSSTNEIVVKEEPMDYVIVKNEENECISLDSSDDEADKNISQKAKMTDKGDSANSDDQKEADPIIVIDDD